MESLRHFLTGLGFTEAAVDRITACFILKKLSKADFFSKEGSINPYIAFISKGVFQYYFNQDGQEMTTYVVGQNGFLASLLSVLQKKPAQENIRALTEAELWVIHKEDFDRLKAEEPGFMQFYVQLLEYQIICIDESRFSLLTQTAEERYRNLLEKEPQLLQQLPLQLLASTLGITPRHLSRIRNKIR